MNLSNASPQFSDHEKLVEKATASFWRDELALNYKDIALDRVRRIRRAYILGYIRAAEQAAAVPQMVEVAQ